MNSREPYNDSTNALLNEGGRVRGRIIKANAVHEKLSFVSEVVGHWIRNGGLGRLDEDAGGEKLYWEGLVAKGGNKNLDRITVGRYGGDLPAKVVVG